MTMLRSEFQGPEASKRELLQHKGEVEKEDIETASVEDPSL